MHLNPLALQFTTTCRFENEEHVQEADEEEEEAATVKDTATPEPGDGDVPTGDLAANGAHVNTI